MKLLFVFLCGITLFSCKSQDDSGLKDRLTAYFIEQLKDSTNSLGELAIIEIDTLTQLEINLIKADLLFDEIIKNDVIIDELSASSETDRKIMKLSSGVDDKMYVNSIKSFDSKIAKMDSLISKTHILSVAADSLNKVVADSIQPLFYRVKCAIKYSRKDLSVVKDTVKAFLNLKKEIIRKEDIR